MTENPSGETPDPESLPHGSDGNPAPADTPARSSPKKLRSVIVLAVIGLALLWLGYHIYPRRADIQAAAAPDLGVQSESPALNDNIGSIFYTVDQVHPDLAKVTVGVLLGGGSWAPGSSLEIQLALTGQHIVHCSPDCTLVEGNYNEAANFKPLPQTGEAFATFLVRASSFGAPANGVTAEATVPGVGTTGLAAGPQYLWTRYENFPSVSSYDWSPDPPQFLGNYDAVWGEPLEKVGTSSRIVVGTNHGAQQRDSNFTLFAGILFGIGGGALIAAVQEWLHD